MTTSVIRLFLVRHGATQLTAEDRFSGSAPAWIFRRGPRAGRGLADRLAQEKMRRSTRARSPARWRRRRSSGGRTGHADRTRRPGEIATGAGKASPGRRSRRASRRVRGLGDRPVHVRARGRRIGGRGAGARAAGGAGDCRQARGPERHRRLSQGDAPLVISSLLGFDARGYPARITSRRPAST